MYNIAPLPVWRAHVAILERVDGVLADDALAALIVGEVPSDVTAHDHAVALLAQDVAGLLGVGHLQKGKKF